MNKLKSSQKEKVKQFITFTDTGEKTAIHCLSAHDWRLDLATDNYFQDPEKYNKETKCPADKKKVSALFEKYKDGKEDKMLVNGLSQFCEDLHLDPASFE